MHPHFEKKVFSSSTINIKNFNKLTIKGKNKPISYLKNNPIYCNLLRFVLAQNLLQEHLTHQLSSRESLN